jgi:hypothetical protein
MRFQLMAGKSRPGCTIVHQFFAKRITYTFSCFYNDCSQGYTPVGNNANTLRGPARS